MTYRMEKDLEHLKRLMAHLRMTHRFVFVEDLTSRGISEEAIRRAIKESGAKFDIVNGHTVIHF